jgi:hypothetical protein
LRSSTQQTSSKDVTNIPNIPTDAVGGISLAGQEKKKVKWSAKIGTDF